MSKPTKPKALFKFPGCEKPRCVEGQEARSLRALVDAGANGVTALEVSTWALRLAHYVMKLKRHGLEIETVRETHDGPAGSGWHGRYILKTPVQVIEGEAA